MVPDLSGAAVAQALDHHYCLTQWTDGRHFRGTELTATLATVLGETVGRRHHALDAVLPPTEPGPVGARSTQEGVAIAERYLDLIRRRPTRDAFDDLALTALPHRITLLRAGSGSRPGSHPLPPYGWTHGDLQANNLLWSDDRVAGILDWDRVAVRPLAHEVVRTAAIQFCGPDGVLALPLVTAFVTGYRRLVDIDDAALIDGADRLWWQRLTESWILELHYDRDDTGCDHLFEPAERLLRWWTPRREAVRRALTGR